MTEFVESQRLEVVAISLGVTKTFFASFSRIYLPTSLPIPNAETANSITANSSIEKYYNRKIYWYNFRKYPNIREDVPV